MSSFKPKKVEESSSHGAYLYALRLLAKQEYSVHKLKQKLKMKGFEPIHLEAALIELDEKGYLSNERYADSKVKQLAHKGHSISSIRRLLSDEKIELNEAEISNIFEEIPLSEDDQIIQLLNKKRPCSKWLGSSPEARKNRDRAIRFALQKGHSYSSINAQLGVILHHLELDNELNS